MQAVEGLRGDRYYYRCILPPFPSAAYEESPRTTENRVTRYRDEKKGIVPSTPPRILFVAS